MEDQWAHRIYLFGSMSARGPGRVNTRWLGLPFGRGERSSPCSAVIELQRARLGRSEKFERDQLNLALEEKDQAVCRRSLSVAVFFSDSQLVSAVAFTTEGAR
jgi:hypothetical protein